MEQTLGKRIVAHRKRLGLTQDQLAEKLGVTAQAVSKWENDQSCPDITILPKLAEIFGTTTDSLLGITPEEPAREATVVDTEEENENEGIHFRNGNWEFKYDNSRRGGIAFAALVLLIGGLYLVTSLLKLDIGLWDLIWPSALLVYGIYAQRSKFSFFGLGCIIFGGFFLVNSFVPVQVQLDNGVIIAVIILLIGGSLLVDSLRKPKKPAFSFSYDHNKHDTMPRQDFDINGESFQFDASFGEQEQFVVMPKLDRGDVNTSFGEFTVDLSGVMEITDNCRICANSSFGELTIRVPKRYTVRCVSSAAFASVENEGRPDPEPQGIIVLEANASFGQITVEYI